MNLQFIFTVSDYLQQLVLWLASLAYRSKTD